MGRMFISNQVNYGTVDIKHFYVFYINLEITNSHSFIIYF